MEAFVWQKVSSRSHLESFDSKFNHDVLPTGIFKRVDESIRTATVNLNILFLSLDEALKIKSFTILACPNLRRVSSAQFFDIGHGASGASKVNQMIISSIALKFT